MRDVLCKMDESMEQIVKINYYYYYESLNFEIRDSLNHRCLQRTRQSCV